MKNVSWSNVVIDEDKENNDEGLDRPDPDETCNDENFTAESNLNVEETT